MPNKYSDLYIQGIRELYIHAKHNYSLAQLHVMFGVSYNTLQNWYLADKGKAKDWDKARDEFRHIYAAASVSPKVKMAFIGKQIADSIKDHEDKAMPESEVKRLSSLQKWSSDILKDQHVKTIKLDCMEDFGEFLKKKNPILAKELQVYVQSFLSEQFSMDRKN